jgi:N-acetylglucosamine kinase-like BadF-type ATPase
MALYLGVDGGGSKTAFVLLDHTGRIAAEAEGPSCYYFASGIELVAKVLSDGIGAVTAAAGVDTAQIDYAFFGLPGYGELGADVPRLRAIPRELLGHDRYTCDNDMIGGWAGALGGRDGINVVAGTGSMAYGERRGAAHRVGGWSELFGDEGSAYWVAVRGLNAFSRMSDGRLPRGPLYDILKARVGVTRDLDLIGVVLDRWRGVRGEIADLSKAVVEAEAAGDRAAAAILADACRELTGLVEATRIALGYGGGPSGGDLKAGGEPVPVSYSGGMFAAPAFLAGFTAALDDLGPVYRLSAPMFGPAVGSALYAMKKRGAAIPSGLLGA